MLVAVFAVSLLPGIASAQTLASGTIAGVVRDVSSAVLPGVTVEISSPALIEKTRSVVTDGQGQYRIVDLRPGTYAVVFTLPGFATVRREGLEVTSGFTATVNADLKVGSLEETVTVSGASPVVDTQNVSQQNVLRQAELDSLPTFKNLQGVGVLTVGASTTGGHDVGGTRSEIYSSITIHGSKVEDARMDLDGMRYQNMWGYGGGLSRLWFLNSAIVQELVLETSGMSAEAENGGPVMNAVPKDGGNRFTGYMSNTFSNNSMQNRNIDDALRARGLQQQPSTVRRIWDYGGGLGGPVAQDKLWFYTAHRWWGAQEFGSNYPNSTAHTPFYTPDFTQDPAYSNVWVQDHSARFTWQAAQKHKLTYYLSRQRHCQCRLSASLAAGIAPEAMGEYSYLNTWLHQGTYTYPVTNKLLLQAGWLYLRQPLLFTPQPGVLPTDISTIELSTGQVCGSLVSTEGAYTRGGRMNQQNQKVSMSYVTGAHAFKVGLFTLQGIQEIQERYLMQDLTYFFSNQRPVSLRQYAWPQSFRQNVKLNMGLFAQDQWRVGSKLTLNLGLRFDYLNAYVPPQTRPAGKFVDSLSVPRIDNLPNHKDLSPRVGVAYDLFGNGKTAVKFSVGRYVFAGGAFLAQVNNPANQIVLLADRTWADGNGNYVPDCDLRSNTANGECGALSNSLFGTVAPNTRYTQDTLEGFGARPYNWQTSVGVQHELAPGIALNVGYFRTWFGNFLVQQNVLAAPSDYDPYCVTVPVDARLPGGGGNQRCGFYDISRAKFGQVNNVVNLATDSFGRQTEVFNGVDITVTARVNRMYLSGGVGTGRTETNRCYTVDNPQQSNYDFAVNPATALIAANPAECHVTPPWSAATQVKASAIYPLPWDMSVSGTFQNLPGIPIFATWNSPNSAIAPSLGRNLASCPATGTCTSTAIVPIVPAATMYEDRLNQVDIRLTKGFQVRQVQLRAMLDLYNFLNGNTVTSIFTTYGPAWLRPSAIQGPRLFKVGMQLDF